MIPSVLFVPGLNCTARLFDRQIAGLSGERDVHVADHCRHEDLATMAAAILVGAPDRFVLAGLSMGGYVAFEIIRQAPERVAGLVLMDTTARPDTAEASERRRRLIGLAEGGRFSDIPDLQIPMLIPPERAGDADLVALIRSMAAETGANAFVRQQKAILTRPDSRPTLAAVTCPTLVIVGDRDAITPPDHAAEMAGGIAGARLVVVPDCGHLSSIERPEAVTAALRDFLADNRL